ncbi:MAG: sigma factor G inhibitor Gin [Thermoanaerobacteraceae bacterium]|nr:sigma factor G inhibitor Gin [Thermoanaerobacteraceae bacterium]
MNRCFVCGKETEDENILLNQRVCNKCYENIKNINAKDPNYDYYIQAVKLMLQNYVDNL